jgi:DNA polymerase (family X)
MRPLDATEVAKLLAEYGRRTALAGGNPYRAKAYLRAAESLTALTEPLDRILAEGRLREIFGVGEAIADIITRLHRTGTHPFLERMRKEIPAGLLEMLSVPGLRHDKVPRPWRNAVTSTFGAATLAPLPNQKILNLLSSLNRGNCHRALQGAQEGQECQGKRNIGCRVIALQHPQSRRAYSPGAI